MAKSVASRPLPPVPVFLGRGRELGDIARLLEGEQRLLTLVGAGGVGKTSLAIVAARSAEQARTLPGGVRFCDLSEARSSSAVVATLGRALDLRFAASESEADRLRRIGTAIDGHGPTLLLLDNCEQAVAPIADALRIWMERAPRAVWIATSREPLRLKLEQIYQVPPLALPADAQSARDAESVQAFEAFVSRKNPALSLGDEQAPLVSEIVRRLDGLPLALELAAARAARLGLRAVLEKLDRPLEILAGGAHDAAARQRTMRKALAWSWELLDGDERMALEACSVFRAPFAVDAAVEVAARDAREPAGGHEVIESLLDKSMLHATLDAGGGGRIRAYEVVRAFAAEKLEASDRSAAVQERHLRYHARLADEALQATAVGELERRRQACKAELLDFVAALDRAALAGEGERERAASLLVFMLPALEAQEPAPRLMARMEAVLELGDATPSSAVVRVRIARAEARSAAGDAKGAREDLDVALAHARRLGDGALEAQALGAAGLLLWHAGDLEAAARELARAREAARRGRHQEEELLALRRAANLALERLRLDEAERDLESARLLARTLGDERAEAIVLGTSSLVHHRAGRNEHALAAATEALELMRRTGDLPRAAVTSSNLGVIAQELRRYHQARGHFEEGAEAAHRAGDRRLLGFVLGCQGRLEHETGRAAAARAFYQEALRLLDEVGAARLACRFHAALAAAEAELGAGDLAAHHLEQATRQVPPGDAPSAELVNVYRAVAEAARRSASRASPPPLELARTLASHDEDLRLALRLLDGAAQATSPADAAVATRQANLPGEVPVVIASDGTWFQLPGGAVVQLAKRRNLRRVLVALAQRRLDAPGTTLSIADLLAAGWPGERILPSAAAMRVYATLTRLRRLGLGDYIVSRGEGYLFDARAPLVFARTPG